MNLFASSWLLLSLLLTVAAVVALVIIVVLVIRALRLKIQLLKLEITAHEASAPHSS
jgi:hypothetical protein